MKVEIGNIKVVEGEKFDVRDEGWRKVVEIPNRNYVSTIFVMDRRQYEDALKMYGDSVVLLEQRGNLYLVLITEDAKDSLTCLFEIRFETTEW